MTGQTVVFNNVTLRINTAMCQSRIWQAIYVCIALLWILPLGGCSLSKPRTAVLVPSGTTGPSGLKNGSSSSSSRHDNVQGLPLFSGKTMNECQRLIVDEAHSWIGTPYLYAHAEKDSGTDCSGMVMRVYDSALQIKIPRNSAKQAEVCIPLVPEEVEGGDLVFFATGKDSLQVSHVGIMLPDGVSFIHASSSKGVVISSLTAGYYRKRIIMYGRVPALHALISISGNVGLK